MYREDRRNFLFALGALAAVPEPFAEPLKTVGVIALPPPFQNQSATIVEVYCAPGQRSTPHKHPGFVLGYVLEGRFRFQMEGQRERILRSGDLFYEEPGETHLIAESATHNRPARVLAIVIAEQGKPIVEPA